MTYENYSYFQQLTDQKNSGRLARRTLKGYGPGCAIPEFN